MGIDYRAAIGYGFIVDEEVAEYLHPELYEQNGMWRVVEAICREYPLLSFESGSGYDEPATFAIVVSSSSQSAVGRYGDPFGVFMLDDIEPSMDEIAELKSAYYVYGGTSTYGPLAIFDQS